MDVRETQAVIRQFSEERDWLQFHTPKNQWSPAEWCTSTRVSVSC